MIFDPALANPAVKYTTTSRADAWLVKVSTSAGKDSFRVVTPSKSAPIVREVGTFDLRCTDQIDCEKVAKAMRHLIEMFDGKEDPF